MPTVHAIDSGIRLAGIRAWTTSRRDGSFGLGTDESVAVVSNRWNGLQDALEKHGAIRLVSATQIHGNVVVPHGAHWAGWLRMRGVDGHFTCCVGTALAITVADCTPVFIAHPAGAIAALHAGWRGTAAGILDRALDLFVQQGFPIDECVVHLGPSICGRCYEVGAEVIAQVTGRAVHGKGLLDVRAVLADQARHRGVPSISISNACTRCDSAHHFSHRAGDAGRQLGVISYVNAW